MIADRPYLAAQINDVQAALSALADWADNPAKPFPGDAVALADRLKWLAALLLADDDLPAQQTEAERPTWVDEAISPKTADALAVLTARENVGRTEALRRLVGYGELVYRTARLEGGEVLIRRGDEIERIVLLDEQGDPLMRDVVALVWMRPSWSAVACGFPGAEVAAGLDPLEPIARCDRWPVADLVQDDEAERCPTCKRAAKQWRAR